MFIDYFLHTETGDIAAGQESDVLSLLPRQDDFEEPPESGAQLEEDLYITQKLAYSGGTLRNFICQWKAFVHFCVKYKIAQWPVPEHMMCLFARFLAYTFHSSKSVYNYLSGICKLHILVKVKPPNLHDIEVMLKM